MSDQMSDHDINKLVDSFTDLSFKEYLMYKGEIFKTKEDYYQMVKEEMRYPYYNNNHSNKN